MGELSRKPSRRLDSIVLLPHALFFALASVPMPWQHLKRVEVAYRTDGSVSLIRDKYKITPAKFKRRWSRIAKSARGSPLGFPILDASLGDLNCIGNSDTPTRNSKIANQKISGELPDDQSVFTAKSAYSKQYAGCCESLKNYLFENTRRKRPMDIPLYTKGSRRPPTIKQGGRQDSKHDGVGKPTSAVNIGSRNIIKELLNSDSFESTRMEWLEAVRLLLAQGRNLLDLVLYRKRLSFAALDENFNLLFNRAITTKEKKRSRLGTSFHMLRELLKILKYLADAFTLYRHDRISHGDLCASLTAIFRNIGTLTEIYRYKYRLARQIKMCKKKTGSIACLWIPEWRIWCHVMRGHIPLLEEYLTNLVTRMTSGRDEHPLPETKQRKDSNDDIRIKQGIQQELGRSRRVLQHFNEMWRCWKADKGAQSGAEGDSGSGSTGHVFRTLNKYVQLKADEYVRRTVAPVTGRQRRDTKKVELRRRRARTMRLYMKNENARQKEYLENPSLKLKDALIIYTKIREYFAHRRAELAPAKAAHIRQTGDNRESKVYGGPADNSQENIANQSNRHMANQSTGRMTYSDGHDSGILQCGRPLPLYIGFPNFNEEALLRKAISQLTRVSDGRDREFLEAVSIPEHINRVKMELIGKRVFYGIEADLKGEDTFTCYYTVPIEERLTDAFLSVYLWSEAGRQGLFPDYMRPTAESESGLNNPADPDILKKLHRQLHGRPLWIFEYKEADRRIDLNLFCKILRLIIDPVLVDFIIARMNCVLRYKDMEVVNFVGLVRGLEFASFLHALWHLVLDTLLFRPDELLLRHVNTIYLAIDSDTGSIGTDIRKRMPPALGFIEFVACTHSPYCFDFQGLSVQLASGGEPPGDCIGLTRVGQPEGAQGGVADKTVVRTRASEKSIELFRGEILSLVRKAVGCTFSRIVDRWNLLLVKFIIRFRDPGAVYGLRDCETRIKEAIQREINSKMPSRFHPVMFYAPRALGGLGMYSILSVHNVRRATNQPAQKSRAAIPNIFDAIHDSPVFRGSAVRAQLFSSHFSYHEYFTRYSHKKSAFLQDVTVDRKVLHELERVYNPTAALGGADAVLSHSLFSATGAVERESLQSIWTVPEYGGSNRSQKRGASIMPNKRFILWWSPILNRSRVYFGYVQRIDLTGISLRGKLSSLKTSLVQIFRGHLWQRLYAALVSAVSDSLAEHYGVRRSQLSRSKCHIPTPEHVLMIEGELQAVRLMSVSSDSADCRCWGDCSGGCVIYQLAVNIILVWGDIDQKNSCEQAKKAHHKMGRQTHSLVIVLDLCYSHYSFYGHCNMAICDRLSSAMADFVQHERLLQIFQERLRISLGLTRAVGAMCPIDTFRTDLICELYGSALYMLNPKTGNLYFRRMGHAENIGKDTLRRNTRQYRDGPAHCDSLSTQSSVADASAGSDDTAAIDDHGSDRVDEAVRRIIEENREAAKDEQALRMLTEMSMLNAREVCLDTRLYKYAQKHSVIFKNTVFLRSAQSLHLNRTSRVSAHPLRKAQNIYFPGESPFTSFCRLKLFLLALHTREEATRLSIHFDRGWRMVQPDDTWPAIETRLRGLCEMHSDIPNKHSESHGLSVAGVASNTTEASASRESWGWREDFIRQTQLIRSGNMLRLFDNIERFSETVNSHSNLHDGLAQTAALRVPENILKCFAMLSRSSTLVRAYIKTYEPFTVAILPQYLSTFQAPSDYQGVFINQDLELREKLEIVVTDTVRARAWHDNHYAPVQLSITKTHGVFLFSDWNFNFRASLFRRTFTLAEAAPTGFYGDRSREGHFREFIERIKQRKPEDKPR